MSELEPFLQATEVIDWKHPAIQQQAKALAIEGDATATTKACFEFVRDEVLHSRDFARGPATWRASEVLQHRTGYCYAKSHLLAALLRANGIPAGFCYQRLSVNDAGPPYSLHGYNAVLLPEHGWYRVDARGNRPGVDAQFAPPREQLAFALQDGHECEFAEILPEPLACVIEVLRSSAGWQEVLKRLPDVAPENFATLGLSVRALG